MSPQTSDFDPDDPLSPILPTSPPAARRQMRRIVRALTEVAAAVRGALARELEKLEAPLDRRPPDPEETAMSRDSPTAELKPERIQDRLRGLPGWQLAADGRTALERAFDFPAETVALAFLAYASEAAHAHGRRPRLTLLGSRVEITLPADGDAGEADLEFAVSLVLPPGPGAARR